MTFEEWLEENYPKGPILNSCKPVSKEVGDFMRDAWEAGYEQGFQIGVDEGYGTGLYDGKGAPF
jgi:hypothetical protein